MSDWANAFDPWPKPGDKIRFNWSIPFAYHVRCAYMVDDKKNPGRKKPKWQWWVLPWMRKPKMKGGTWHPFLTVQLGKYGFYIGCKPVNLKDPNFVVPAEWRAQRATEFSVRISNSR